MKTSPFSRVISRPAYQDTFKPGDWNVIDDITGFKVKASETRKQWDGMRSTKALPRHEQDFLRAIPERAKTPWARPEGDDVFNNSRTKDDVI